MIEILLKYTFAQAKFELISMYKSFSTQNKLCSSANITWQTFWDQGLSLCATPRGSSLLSGEDRVFPWKSLNEGWHLANC